MSPLLPSCFQFYLIMNVAVGGTGGAFPDGINYGSIRKPWSNSASNAAEQFWNARNEWLPSWQGDNVALLIDYVQFNYLQICSFQTFSLLSYGTPDLLFQQSSFALYSFLSSVSRSNTLITCSFHHHLISSGDMTSSSKNSEENVAILSYLLCYCSSIEFFRLLITGAAYVKLVFHVSEHSFSMCCRISSNFLIVFLYKDNRKLLLFYVLSRQ